MSFPKDDGLDLVGAGTAAKVIGVGTRRIDDLAVAGEIPSIPVDGGVRRVYRRADIEHYAAERLAKKRSAAK